MGQNEPSYAPQPPVQQGQPYLPRDAQPFPPRDQQVQNRPQPQQQPYQQPSQGNNEGGGQDLGGLPAFITGGGGPQPQQNPAPNGHEQGDRGQDRFGHRRRRRHRGGGYRPDRPEFGGNNPQTAAPQPDEGGDEPRQPD
jgi:hypothetical protein